MGLDSLKQQIRQMQELKINGIYVLNPSQRNILDDVLEKLADYMCISRKLLEELMKNQPPDYALGQKGIKWFEKFEKLLEDSK